MTKRQSGFSLYEMMIVVAVMGILAAMALPNALSALKGYRLHADATAISSFLNVIRMKSAANYAPYRLNLTISSDQYTMEKLCGDTPSSVDTNCTSAYAQFTTPQYDLGTQYISQGVTISGCRPSGITAYPLATITADPSPCPTTVQFYFNTRGLPVNSTGNPLTNGGQVIYLTNQNQLSDAITASMGGRVVVWNYSGGVWAMR